MITMRDELGRQMAIENPTKRNWHKRARAFVKKECEGGCQRHSRGPLHVHHVDRNWRNLAKGNLLTLCERAHLREHGKLRGRAWSAA